MKKGTRNVMCNLMLIYYTILIFYWWIIEKEPANFQLAAMMVGLMSFVGIRTSEGAEHD